MQVSYEKVFAVSASPGASSMHIIGRAVLGNQFWKDRQTTFTRALPMMLEKAKPYESLKARLQNTPMERGSADSWADIAATLWDLKQQLLPGYTVTEDACLDIAVQQLLKLSVDWNEQTDDLEVATVDNYINLRLKTTRMHVLGR